MPTLDYPLQDGYVHHWLVAGPQAQAIADLARFQGPDPRGQIAERCYRQDSGMPAITGKGRPPQERAIAIEGTELVWRYQASLEDHLLDVAGSPPTPQHLSAWAYVELVSPRAQQVDLALSTYGPADLWLNGLHVHRHGGFSDLAPEPVACPMCLLQEGANPILVRFEQVALGPCPYALALRVGGVETETLRVQVPCYNERTDRRRRNERMVHAAFVERAFVGSDEELVVRWPDDLDDTLKVTVRVQSPEGRIYAEARPDAKAASRQIMIQGFEVPTGWHRARVMSDILEYYMGNMRVINDLDVYILQQEPQGADAPGERTLGARAHATLVDAATRRTGLYAELAKMALNQWANLDLDTIHAALRRVNERHSGCAVDLLGLLAVEYRYAGSPMFPPDLAAPIVEAVLGFPYDEEATSEQADLVLYACQALAGQRYPDRTFGGSDKTGRWHAETGARRALDWLQRRARGGFPQWDSAASLGRCVLGGVSLLDLAEEVRLREMAAVIVDKALLTLAVNSFRGTFGYTSGTALIDGRLDPAAGLSWLLWGQGLPNDHVAAPVALACSDEYEFPSLLREIATDHAQELWARERHTWEAGEGPGGAAGDGEVNKVAFKTADGMLCSVQDHRPGQPGRGERAWQATLGPDAIVFVNHPACASRRAAYQPGFWAGNRALPRIAQWRDALIAVHKLPDDDWMGYTHAYFPAFSFDEYELQEGADGRTWAFARKGDGYLALCAAQGMELIRHGPSAYRELRSYGGENTWLCQMGRAATDRSFSRFKKAVLAAEVDLRGLSARWRTVRGDEVAFGWQGPLTVNGQEQPLSGFPHYENPYCRAGLGDSTMDVQFGDWILRLDFDPAQGE